MSVTKTGGSQNARTYTEKPNDVGAKGSGKTIEVKNSEELKSALENAESGTTIRLADGEYNGNFELKGKSNITIEGSRNAKINGGDTSNGYALHIQDSDNVTLKGFSVEGAEKGIVLDNSNKNLLEDLSITGTGQEAVHFRNNSSHNVIQNSFIDDTGKTDPGYGEGVYIGSDDEKGIDRSNFNMVLGVEFGNNVRAENVDIKEHTEGSVVAYSRLNDAGLTGAHFADSVIDVKPDANGSRIFGNSEGGDLLI